MVLKIGLSLLGVLVLFLLYVSTRESHFNYSVTQKINAPVEKVFPYLSDFKLGSEWSPFEKVDPHMKKEYLGNKMNFEGNKDAGSGSLEFLDIKPNESVLIRLIMTAPIAVDNKVTYHVVPVEGGTQLTWAISGENGYLMKLIGVFIDCEKMMQEQFTAGINNLKAIVEK